jgi:hypothetical protein
MGFCSVFNVFCCVLLFVWPVIHCPHCYYKVKAPRIEKENIVELLPVNKWKESYLKKHVDCGKKWGSPHFMILWLGPIVLIGISFFLSFSIFALISLISFIVVLAVMLIQARWKVCPTCAIMEECHAAF